MADTRVHGTTGERPEDRLLKERSHLGSLPERGRLTPFLREERKVGRDGYVQWQGAWYGVPWTWTGQGVQVQAENNLVEVWSGEQRLAVHPRPGRSGQRFTLPGQWSGLRLGDSRPKKDPLATQVEEIEVQQRPLELYQALVAGGGR